MSGSSNHQASGIKGLIEWGKRVAARLAPYRQTLGIVASVTVLALALLVCWHLLSEVNLKLVHHAILNISLGALASSLLAAVCSYLALVCYEWSAARFAGVILPGKLLVMGGACATAVGNAVGLSMLSGGAVRARLYLNRGLHAADIARMSVFVSLALGVTLPVLAAIAGLIHLDTASTVLDLPPLAAFAIAAAILALYLALIVVLFFKRQPEKPSVDSRLYRFGSWSCRLPSLRLSLLQLVITLADVIGSCAVLYLLLPASPPFATFLLVYLLALAAGILSHVPGGVGVFEAIMLATFSPIVGVAELTAALVLYRAIYIVLPLLLSILTLLINEGRRFVDRMPDPSGTGLSAPVLSLVVFFDGLVLLASNVMPESTLHYSQLIEVVPAWLVELSHLLCGMAGVTLLMLARGLGRRMHAAWRLTLWVLALGALTSVLKGIDLSEAILMTLSCIGLFIFRSSFYRIGHLARMPFSWRYLLVGYGILLLSLWLLLIIFRDVPWSSHIWWSVSISNEVSRSLRSVIGSGLLLLLYTLIWRLRPHKGGMQEAADSQTRQAYQIACQAGWPETTQVIAGGYALLFSTDHKAFLAFRQHEHCLIAMSDPVGDRTACASLVWDFRDMAEEHQLTPVIYPATEDHLLFYQNAGLVSVRVATEFLLQPAHLEWQAPEGESLEQSHADGLAMGLRFELYQAGQAPLEELARVSAEWLAAQQMDEKHYMCGYFDPEYLDHFRIVVVRYQGQVVAFSNLMESQQTNAVRIDLARWNKAAPGQVAEWMLLALVKQLEQEGVEQLSLGIVPMARVRRGPAGGFGHILSQSILNQGEALYDQQRFDRLRERLRPDEAPRYLILPLGADPSRALASVARLIKGE